jgi:hypothetical protein
MLGRRSLNLDLISLDPEIERTLRRRRRPPVVRESVEMRDNVHAGENERHRGENVDHTRSLGDLFAPVATNSSSYIVLPPSNATHLTSSLMSSNSYLHSMAWTLKILIAM